MTVFMFNSKSFDALPGRGAKEKLSLDEKSDFEQLKSIKDWRKNFSNMAPSPIVVDGKHYATVEHFYHAQKFVEGNPDFASTAVVHDAALSPDTNWGEP